MDTSRAYGRLPSLGGGIDYVWPNCDMSMFDGKTIISRDLIKFFETKNINCEPRKAYLLRYMFPNAYKLIQRMLYDDFPPGAFFANANVHPSK